MLYEFFADGFEEIEAITPCDYLRRCGVEVVTVGVPSKTVTGAHGMPVECDCTLEEVDVEGLEGVILPGGPGHTNLYASQKVRELVTYAAEEKLLVSAICAAPSILGKMGLLKNKKATCYPGYENDLMGAVYTGRAVAVDGNFITGKGAGAAMQFAFELATYLKGRSAAVQMGKDLQWDAVPNE